MPKTVDHILRRREVAQAAVRIIAREGLEGATTRAVAAESGWSTGVLKHYFSGKEELLHHALREVEAVAVEALDTAASEPTGYLQLQATVQAMLPGSSDHSKVWIAFMSRALSDPATAREINRAMRAWLGRWEKLVRRGQLDGSIRDDLDAAAVARELWALISGLRMEALFVPAMNGQQGATLATLEAMAARRDGPTPCAAPGAVREVGQPRRAKH